MASGALPAGFSEAELRSLPPDVQDDVFAAAGLGAGHAAAFRADAPPPPPLPPPPPPPVFDLSAFRPSALLRPAAPPEASAPVGGAAGRVRAPPAPALAPPPPNALLASLAAERSARRAAPARAAHAARAAALDAAKAAAAAALAAAGAALAAAPPGDAGAAAARAAALAAERAAARARALHEWFNEGGRFLWCVARRGRAGPALAAWPPARFTARLAPFRPPPARVLIRVVQCGFGDDNMDVVTLLCHGTWEETQIVRPSAPAGPARSPSRRPSPAATSRLRPPTTVGRRQGPAAGPAAPHAAHVRGAGGRRGAARVAARARRARRPRGRRRQDAAHPRRGRGAR